MDSNGMKRYPKVRARHVCSDDSIVSAALNHQIGGTDTYQSFCGQFEQFTPDAPDEDNCQCIHAPEMNVFTAAPSIVPSCGPGARRSPLMMFDAYHDIAERELWNAEGLQPNDCTEIEPFGDCGREFDSEVIQCAPHCNQLPVVHSNALPPFEVR